MSFVKPHGSRGCVAVDDPLDAGAVEVTTVSLTLGVLRQEASMSQNIA